MPDGGTLRDHLQRAAETSEKAAAELEEEIPPPRMRYLIDWFSELKAAAASSGMGPTIITWEAIAAWMAVTGREPSPWELRVIFDLDAVANQVALETKKTQDSSTGSRRGRTPRRPVRGRRR